MVGFYLSSGSIKGIRAYHKLLFNIYFYHGSWGPYFISIKDKHLKVEIDTVGERRASVSDVCKVYVCVFRPVILASS